MWPTRASGRQDFGPNHAAGGCTRSRRPSPTAVVWEMGLRIPLGPWTQNRPEDLGTPAWGAPPDMRLL